MSQAPVIRRRGSRDLNPNHKRLYQLIRRAGQVSRADLMRRSGLTFPSVSRIVTELLELGLLLEGAKRRGGMGKPPVDLTINPDHGYSLGIHLDGNQASGSLINALGKPLKSVSFSAASLSEGISRALDESGFAPDKLVGICLSTPSEVMKDDQRARLAAELGVPIFAEPAIAASVRAERYFGSASELNNFLYFDAVRLELGAMVNHTVLAQLGTLQALLGMQQGESSAGSDKLPRAIRGAAVLIQAQALIVSGLSAEDIEGLSRQVADLPVVPASAQAGDPTLAAASVPLYETLSG